MKALLLIISLLGFSVSAYFLVQDATSFDRSLDHLIYISLLAILMCNCLIGIAMSMPQRFRARKIRIMRRAALRQ